ncbi:MAG: zinc-dependent metalloprotease, partial [Nitrospirae bacterium]|nr:zinc-dependent metalloprotease [Nitrospirota bacterium]
QRSSGTQLRTYRLAVAATGEYTAYFGGTVPLGLAAVVSAVNRVTGIYEAEVAVRLQLVENNNLIVYTNQFTDPYTDSDCNPNECGIIMLGQNQTNLDSVIGNDNYDIGHVFSTGGGGVAYLRVPCVTGLKARGVTGSSIPTGDVFWVDYVAHEMGHQFGANHTFNSETGSCNGNGEPSTAYEPGSGSTIMAYAGICGPDDLQSNSDAYFHTVSFDEILDYITWDEGSTCGTVANSGNIPPVANAGSGGLTIPANTPFTLTGSAIDSNGDPLTYCWEEFDLIDPTGVIDGGPPGDPTNPPFFRSWPATSSPSRTFPRLSELLNNTTVLGEVLPDTSRALNFRLTVRDNRSGGGGVDYDSMTFNVTSLAGPFQVTAPNTAVSWAGNSSQTVTWNVANTGSGTTVNCANVGILLSTDGGYTFPTTLAPSTPNDGSQSVTVPNVSTATARIKVYCTGNIFFDISNSNFTITYTPIPVAVTVTTSPSGRQITVDGTTYTPPQTFNWIPGGSHTIAISDAQTTQSGSPGTQYVYASWSDGGTKSHTITAPATPTTYTANFTTQYLLTTATAGAAGNVTPNCPNPSSCWYNSGSTVSLSPSPNGGNTFSLWSEDINSFNAPLVFAMTGPKSVMANFNSVAVTGDVRIGGSAPVYYPTIAAAYAAAINNDVIQTKVMTYAETLDFNRADIPTVTLRGGYNGTYSDNTGKSTINSPLTIRSGTITLDNFIVR